MLTTHHLPTPAHRRMRASLPSVKIVSQILIILQTQETDCVCILSRTNILFDIGMNGLLPCMLFAYNLHDPIF
jgi:hypothetical protein